MVQVGVESENGWRPARLAADRLDRSPVPGTNVVIPLMDGIPSKILKAFIADIHAFAESIYNARGGTDEGGWTPSNSVATSNHLNGTAVDFNWEDHPMGPAAENAGWNPTEIAIVREILAYYTWNGIQLVWWAGDWNSPKDSMHFQMGYRTWDHQETCLDFIRNRIRPDGFSTFRREAAQPPRVARKVVVPAGGGTFWSDVSQYQGGAVNDSYPHRVFSFRTNSGDQEDTLAVQNARVAKELLSAGKLDIVIPYYFFRPGQANCDLHREILERAAVFNHPRTVTMVDVEGDKGSVTGDNSWEINDEVNRVRGWYGNQQRVIGYLNSNADGALWRTRGGVNLVVPQYDRTPGDISSIKDGQVRTDAIAHQFTQSATDVQPWAPGAVDVNWSPYSVDELLLLFAMKEGPTVPDQAQMVKELWDRFIGIPWYDGKWPSTAMFRDDNEGVGDTVALIRWANGTGYDVAVILGAISGNAKDVAKVRRLANGEGPEGDNKEAVDCAKAILGQVEEETESV